MNAETHRVTIAGVEWQRTRPPGRWDWTPVVLFMGVSGDASAERRRREQEFEALHYPHLAVLTLGGGLPPDGPYQITPRWAASAPQEPDLREVNLRPWRLEGQTLRGHLTAAGQAELQRWLTGGLRELSLTAAEG